VGGAALAALAGLAVIHAGGLAQLTILTGDLAPAFAMGVVPFVLGDLLKVGLAALVIGRFLPSTRALG
jgi:biotin transport system substrate-specific component